MKVFSHQQWSMASHWSSNDSSSPQVSKTLLSILANLNIDVVWMVSVRPLISKSASSFTIPLVAEPRAPITIGITVTFMFYRFSCKFQVLIFLFFFFFNFTSWSAGTAKTTIQLVLCFLLTITGSGRLSEIKRTVCFSFSWTDSGLYIYHIFVRSNFSFLQNTTEY